MKTALLGALVASLLFVSQATPQETPPAVPVPAVQAGHACAQHFSLSDYRHYASRIYKRKSVGKRAHHHLTEVQRCLRTPWAVKWALRFRHRYKRERTTRREIAAVTPYSCSFGPSAIPCYIVLCESGGDWAAANPSGAIGRYQFLGKRIVWPVRTGADKAAHHRLAAFLWDHGRGAHHWQQCL